jgi:hypothetical protein
MPTPTTTLARIAALGTLAALIMLTAGTASAGTIRHGIRPPGRASVTSLIVYATHTQTLSANGTSLERVMCPGDSLPVGGGTVAQDPRVEQVTQAGFYASAPGRFAGYQASVRVRGVSRGGKVRFAVQVACVPAPATVIYSVHTQTISANGSSLANAACPAGGLPVGGGTVAEDPRIEQVTQAGFRGSAPGRVVGYQARLLVHGLPHGSKVRFTVQVACAPPPALPTYGPPTKAL